MSADLTPPSSTHIDLSDEHLSDLSDSNLSDLSSTEDTINDESEDDVIYTNLRNKFVFQTMEQARQIVEESIQTAMEARKNEKEARKKEKEARRKAKKTKQKLKRTEEEKKQKGLIEANSNIIKAQSETINLIKPVLLHFSPGWFEDLSKFISDFLLLNDGHILFSRTWLKNDITILSTPLLFRPIYNIILHEMLRFICDFEPGGPKERQGAAFYIAGDQGIGKTSLMLILMSTLSHRSIDFHYEKGFKDNDPQDFAFSKNPDGSYSLNDLRDDRSRLNEILIHIYDDCPPPATIKPNNVHLIFTSPDPLRLPIPEPSPNHLCHIYRLPTFSLAEDAVAMVGCTPTVPFAVLSPEDMQLHTKDQQILLDIESEKEDLAGRLSSTFVDIIKSSRNSSIRELLKLFCDVIKDLSTRWNDFETEFQRCILDKTIKDKTEEQKLALKYLFPKPEQSEPVNQEGQVTPEPIDSGDAARTEQKSNKASQKAKRTPPSTPNSTSTPPPPSVILVSPVTPQPDHFNQTPPPINQPGHITTQTDVTTATVTDSNEEETPSVLTAAKLRSDIEARLEPKSEEAPVNEDPKPNETTNPVKKTAKKKKKDDPEKLAICISLCDILFETRDKPERERIIAVVDWLMKQLEVHSKRSQEQAEFIKGFIRFLVLFEWDQSEQQDQDAQNAEATTTAQNTQNEGGEDEHDLEEPSIPGEGTDLQEEGKDTLIEIPKTAEELAALQKEKEERERQRVITEKLFEKAFSYAPPSPNIVEEIRKFSVMIKEVKLTNPQTSPSPKNLTDLTEQLVRLKTLIEGPNVSEVANRQKVRDEVTRVYDRIGEDDKTRRDKLFKALIDMLITPPPYDSKKKVLQSLFVIPEEDVKSTDAILRNNLSELLTQSRDPRNQQSDSQTLAFIVNELIGYLLYSQTSTDPPSSAKSDLTFDKKKMASMACDFLMKIVNPPVAPVDPAHERASHSLNPMDPPHIQVQKRLDYVQNQIEQVRDRLWFVSLMDSFFFIARDMNILVTPHSILKGLSERPESTSAQDLTPERKQVLNRNARLNIERMNVYYGNLSDDGLREWIDQATATLLHRPDTTEKTPLEEIQSAIRDNLNTIITQFNNKYKPSECSVINRQWLAIVRSVMNTILYLIDAGTPRCEIFKQYGGLRDLLTTVYKSNQDHLLRVADQRLIQNCEEPKSDYVNDLTVFSTHFRAQKPLSLLELPRTLQLAPLSQDRLEQMSIALFARNLLCFLQMKSGLHFDDKCYLTEFYSTYLQQDNPGDIVHRSFVDFMNATHLLSQEHFGLTPDKFTDFLKTKHPTIQTDLTPLQKLRQISPLASLMETMIKPDVTDPKQPFKNFLTRQFGVHFLLWASTNLLLKAADAIPSQESGEWKTVSRLNVARASIFGPSPRWLTSTDARTNRGLKFLWNGVLRSETIDVLKKVADSNHSRIMEFNTPRIFFEQIMDATWDDITALIPLLPNYREKEKRPSLLRSVYSLIFKKTAIAIAKMQSQIPFVALSSFVEQIMQSEVVAALAKLMTQAKYDEFKDHQTISGFKLPPYVEEPLVCISFLLNCPTPISFYETTTSFTEKHFYYPKQSIFQSHFPCLDTDATKVTTMPMLTFPNISNKSVHGTTFPHTLSETKRGKSDFYAEDLQELEDDNLPGLDSLIVSRGSDETSETIFMAIQATCAKSHALVEKGVILIQQLLFQAMCRLEPSEPIVAMYNYATTQETFQFPSRTGILGFHMVSSYLKFDENTLEHMSSILRHRDRPLVTNPTESQAAMTTTFITNTLLKKLPDYPAFSEKFNPWKTTLSVVNNPTAHSIYLPFGWKLFYDDLTKSWSDQFVQDEEVRITMQELHRVGVTPDDLGESVEDRITTFKGFILNRAISSRRNELFLRPTRENDVNFVKLVESIVGTDTSPTFKAILTLLDPEAPNAHQFDRDERLQQFDSLYREHCIQTRMYPVYRVISHTAMKRIRNPVQEYLSVIQSKKDGDVFRVPTRNNLSAILHCGTVLLDHISPLPGHSITPSPTTDNSSTPTPHSQNVTPSLSRSKTLNIPLHSFVLATHGFSTSIPSLCGLTQDAVQKEATNVTPSPLIQWLPHRVVIDPSLFPSHITHEKSLSLFTTFFHRLFDNPFIPVSTSLPTAILDRQHSNDVLLTQLHKIITALEGFEKKKDDGMQNKVNQLSTILAGQQASSVISLLPEIRQFSRMFGLKGAAKSAVKTAIKEIESIEAIQQQPTLVFVKAGNDLFPPSTENPEFVVDTKTKAHLFPIPFSTGYKEGELREEMKLIYKPLTELQPDHFPKEHVSLSHPQGRPIRQPTKTTSSKATVEDKARAIVGSTILEKGKTLITPFFVFVVDENLADHESLPTSLRLDDRNADFRCGVMRQRSFADVLWILFLTRITREVMALSLNTPVESDHFETLILKFIFQVLLDARELSTKHQGKHHKIYKALMSLVTKEHLDNLDNYPSIGIELLVSAYPHLEDKTDMMLLSRLLMMCKSTPKGETRLDILINHPSPTVELDTLIYWFEILFSSIEMNGFKVAIKSGGFTEAKICLNMLRAFYLIIERRDQKSRGDKLFKVIKPMLNETQYLLSQPMPQQVLTNLKHLAHEQIRLLGLNHEDTTLASIDSTINFLLPEIPPLQQNTQATLPTPPNDQHTFPTEPE
ncbi:hypothetical protein BLNAU_14232 [Blattamonas nauphoetae]|uniref:Uncharacterized protein n=1 Tax=Blattamonas nauphoetae TaxID=2049346 RepID=A0ABQ9XJ32_9EUKA|nr:hypothetical protein BLNAU_14232 [Blattamonas nauphoetae]